MQPCLITSPIPDANCSSERVFSTERFMYTSFGI